ncbi:hypothetical protein FHS39_002529 [Streptomyces olivoverticillatus]|uniref:Uncharacterized protein n=1 Tax=Streptomyces olivoverticillatus TaxID=66427 RepID=A0A7W7LNH3_9ACTN|nr:hypothetical protein [Streptomyces olivoverticillatus]MBB4893498.1 hypothetical protein [Streptomyces olivoverticillatus]
MNTLAAGMALGVISTSAVILATRFALAQVHRRPPLPRRIADARARVSGRGSAPEDRFLLGQEPLDDIAIADHAAIGIQDITAYLQRKEEER